MSFKKSQVALATTLALGLGVASTSVSAIAIDPGTYNMSIVITPEAYAGSGIPDVGDDILRHSSFTFNAAPSFASQSMLDNPSVAPAMLGDGFGSGVENDGVAGNFMLTVDGAGNMTFQMGQIDTIAGTAGGNFAQEVGTIGSWTGTSTTLATTFNPISRLGGIDGTGLFTGNKWDYASFSTDSASNLVAGGTTIQGTDLAGSAALGYTATFVAGGTIGPEWLTFNGAQFFESWEVTITQKAVVPVPAAAWLFGSGLLGLVGVARRKKSA